MIKDLPNIDTESIKPIDQEVLFNNNQSDHAPRILLL